MFILFVNIYINIIYFFSVNRCFACKSICVPCLCLVTDSLGLELETVVSHGI